MGNSAKIDKNKPNCIENVDTFWLIVCGLLIVCG